MAEFERLDDRSREALEPFLSEAFGEPVRLDGVLLAIGRVGNLVAWLARASGITFGPIIFLRSSVRRGSVDDPFLAQFGVLLVHECVHVWQYRKTGTPWFLGQYLKYYCTNIVLFRTVRPRRMILERAYRSIPFERQAFDIEGQWRSRD